MADYSLCLTIRETSAATILAETRGEMTSFPSVKNLTSWTGQLWSESYERDARDVLALTGDVAQAIAREISARLTSRELAILARRRPVIPEAHEAYLQGRYYWAKVTVEAITMSIGFFQQASQIDPSYPLAYSGLADCYIILGGTILGAAASRDTMPKAKEAALRALALDASLAEAHASLAIVLWRYDWDWPGAEREFKRALELNPSYATGRQWYLYGSGARSRASPKSARRSRSTRSPLGSVPMWDSHTTFARQYDRAIEESRNTLRMDTGFVLANFFLGLPYGTSRAGSTGRPRRLSNKRSINRAADRCI